MALFPVIGRMDFLRVRFFFLIAVLSCLALISCGALSFVDAVVLDLPSEGLPYHDKKFSEAWNISWLGEDGLLQSQSVPSRRFDSFVLSLPRERVIFILAEPLVSQKLLPYRPKPAGAVLSIEDKRPLRVALSWEEGFAASFLKRLFRAGFIIDSINVPRFLKELSEDQQNLWGIDQQRLVEDLLAGKLWVHSFRQRPSFDVDLALPEGSWFPENPLGLVLMMDGKEGRVRLSEGTHFFTAGADGPVVTVFVQENSPPIVLLRP